MAETPEFIGQKYTDTDTGNVWNAESLTLGDWSLQVQDMKVGWTPTGFDAGSFMFFGFYENDTVTSLELKGNASGGIEVTPDSALQTFSSSTVQTIEGSFSPLYIDSCDALTSVVFSAVTHIQDGLTVITCPLLTTVSCPLLSTAGASALQTLPALTTVNLTALATVSGTFSIIDCNIITSISLPSFVSSTGDATISNCGALTTISLPVWVPTNGGDYFFNDNALTAATVNHILARAVANAGFVTGSLSLEGGTNAAPSGQGIVDKATLQGRGVTVTTN